MYSLKSKINNYFENVNLQNISDLGKNFIDIIFIYSFLILNFYIFLILLPPYSHVEYGTIIYDFTKCLYFGLKKGPWIIIFTELCYPIIRRVRSVAIRECFIYKYVA